MDERMRRLWAGAEADTIGWGGVAAVSRATGLAISTVRKGRDEFRAGARPIFFTQGWGREALNYYLVAFAMNWLSPAMALRVTAATLGTLFVALAFLLLRELFDWRVAAIGSAWLASSFWVMMVSLGMCRAIAASARWPGLGAAASMCRCLEPGM